MKCAPETILRSAKERDRTHTPQKRGPEIWSKYFVMFNVHLILCSYQRHSLRVRFFIHNSGMRMVGTECIHNILFILPLGAERMEWHSVHSGIWMRNKRMHAFHILAILIPELWIKNALLVNVYVCAYMANSSMHTCTLPLPCGLHTVMHNTVCRKRHIRNVGPWVQSE